LQTTTGTDAGDVSEWSGDVANISRTRPLHDDWWRSILWPVPLVQAGGQVRQLWTSIVIDEGLILVFSSVSEYTIDFSILVLLAFRAQHGMAPICVSPYFRTITNAW